MSSGISSSIAANTNLARSSSWPPDSPSADAGRIGPLGWSGPHPQAGVLDALVDAVAPRFADSPGEVALSGIDLPDATRGTLWAHLQPLTTDHSTRAWRVSLEDSSGGVVGKIERLSFTMAAPVDQPLAPGLPHYRQHWRSIALAPASQPVRVIALDAQPGNVALEMREHDIVLHWDTASVDAVPAFAQVLTRFDTIAQILHATAPAGARLWLAVTAAATDPMQSMWCAALRAHARARASEWEWGNRWGGTLEMARDLPSETIAEAVAACVGAGRHGQDLRIETPGRLEERVLEIAPQNQSGTLPVPGLAEGSHLVTGATGDLARECMRALVAAGARELVLVSRTIDPDAAFARELADEFGADVRLHLVPTDVSSVDSLRDLHDYLRAAGARPLRGIVHAAAGRVSDEADSLDALVPKVQALLALEQVFPRASLDYVLLFSSWSGSFGEIGMKLGAYAAANAALDGYAEACLRAGSPGGRVISIGWGDWADSRARRQAREAGKALLPELWCFPRAQGRFAIVRALAGDRGHVLATATQWDDFLALFPTTGNERLLAAVTQRTPATASAAGGDARAALEVMVRKLLRRPATDAQLFDTGLAALGFDSLLALDLRGQIHRQFGVLLPISRMLADPTPAALLQDITGAAPASDCVRQDQGLMEMDL